MQDVLIRSLAAGLVGALIVDGLTFAALLLGIPTSTPWEIAADVFLVSSIINSPLGLTLGLIGTFFLSTVSAALILLLMRITGGDHPALKGIAATYSIGFVTLGFFMPLLGIAPWVQREPVTYLVALFVFAVLGAVQGLLLAKSALISSHGVID
ncbi:hypothetical protein ABDB91_11630 [Desulfoscipio sp. XC116]|uniref:hypothetical protein n=1 Tax=Desulfoscipio sp. XC116 TaxID=3144975 RepID=UPI00325BD7D5